MFEYRQVLTRMRLGDTDRAIARVGLMGRRKVAQLRRTAEAAGWLDVATPLPDGPELAVHLGSVRTQPAVASLAEPHRERITRWWRQGVQGTTIHGALVRSHGFTGSYSSVRRFLAGVEAAHPQVTTVLEFDPGEAAQVDFGKGPEILDPRAVPVSGSINPNMGGSIRAVSDRIYFARLVRQDPEPEPAPWRADHSLTPPAARPEAVAHAYGSLGHPPPHALPPRERRARVRSRHGAMGMGPRRPPRHRDRGAAGAGEREHDAGRRRPERPRPERAPGHGQPFRRHGCPARDARAGPRPRGSLGRSRAAGLAHRRAADRFFPAAGPGADLGRVARPRGGCVAAVEV